MMVVRYFLLVFVILLPGCSSLNFTQKPLPPAAYTAKSWPAAPVGAYGPQRLADYIADARSAYLDAIAKLNALNPYLEVPPVP